MNERILELAIEARKYAESKPDIYQVAYDKKFAELIVRECLGCCEQVISDPVPESVDTWLNGGSQCMAEITKHFGVEE